MPLPLHIFEERYKEMMSDIVPAGTEFGVVLVKEGGIVNVGCTARVERILRHYPDGRLDLLAVGQRRFQIASLDENKSYLRAEVEFFNDDDASEIPSELHEKAVAAYRLLIENSGENEEPQLDFVRVSFQLAQLISDLDKRQTVLTLRSEVKRLEYLVRIIPEYLIQRERTNRANRLAPLNGHPKVAL